MFCVFCGTKLPDGVRFCTTCGAKIDNEELVVEDSVMEQMSIEEEAPVVEEIPVVEKNPVVEIPIVEEIPVVEEIPAVDQMPVTEQVPAYVQPQEFVQSPAYVQPQEFVQSPAYVQPQEFVQSPAFAQPQEFVQSPAFAQSPAMVQPQAYMQPQMMAQQEPEKKKSKGLAIFFIILGVLLLSAVIGAVIYFFVLDKDKNDKKEPTAIESTVKPTKDSKDEPTAEKDTKEETTTEEETTKRERETETATIDPETTTEDDTDDAGSSRFFSYNGAQFEIPEEFEDYDTDVFIRKNNDGDVVESIAFGVINDDTHSAAVMIAAFQQEVEDEYGTDYEYHIELIDGIQWNHYAFGDDSYSDGYKVEVYLYSSNGKTIYINDVKENDDTEDYVFYIAKSTVILD